MNSGSTTIDRVLQIFFLLAIIVLFGMVFILWGQNQDLKNSKSEITTNTTTPFVVEEVSGEVGLSKEEVRNIVNEAVSTLPTPEPITVVKKETVIVGSTSGGTKSSTFIPMGSTATTDSTDWVTLDDTAVYIDVKNDYGDDSYIEWEAVLSVPHANGGVFARLWDDTNKIGVVGSELTTANTTSTLLNSSKLEFKLSISRR